MGSVSSESAVQQSGLPEMTLLGSSLNPPQPHEPRFINVTLQTPLVPPRYTPRLPLQAG